MEKTVIGIVGIKQAGKTTSAEFIKQYLEKYELEYKEMALADKLKDTCAKVFDLQRIAFDDQKYKEIPFKVFNIETKLTANALYLILKEYGHCFYKHAGLFEKKGIIGMELKSPRHIAQIVGTEVLRSIGNEDIHCEQLTLNKEYNIITDIRFENEFNFFNNKENIRFMPLYINRKEAEKEVTENSHASEKEVFKFRDKCIHIDNNKAISDLYNNLKHIISLEIYSKKG
jgi:hypothetical protein